MEIMGMVRGATSQTAALILNKLEMIYPNDSKYSIARKAILGALGDHGLNVDLERIIASKEGNGNGKTKIRGNL